MTAGRKPGSLVLDSWAVVAHFQGEPAGVALADLVAGALQARHPVLMSVVNAGEVWYTIARAGTADEADDACAEMGRWGVEMVDVDWPLTRAAAVFKSRHRLSFADAFAAALAKSRKAELVTGDPEFKVVEGEIRMRWLTR